MKKVLLFIVSCIFLSFCSQSVEAATYYIDAQNGNDTNTGSESDPWQNLSIISPARIASGDTVYLKGIFEGGQQILLDSTIQGLDADHPTAITNWPNNSAVIVLSTSHIVEITGNYYSISGIEFNNNGSNLVDSYAIYLNDGYSNLNVMDCVIKDSDHAIKLYNANSDVIVNGNEFVNNLYTVNIGSNTQDLTFSNNIFSNNIEYGIAGNYSTNLKIYNNVFYMAHAGIYIAESTIDLKNNIFSNHDYEAIGFIIGQTLDSDYNIFYNNTVVGRILTDDYYDYATLADWQAQGYDANSTESDPLFVSTTSGSEDFHLQVTSPAIDAGTTVSNITDIDSEIRPYASYDIGADERPLPLAPTGFGATVLSDVAAEIYWTAPADAISSYTLYLGQASDLQDATVYAGITNTSYDFSNLTADTTYYVQLESVYTTSYQEYLSDRTTIFSFTTQTNNNGNNQDHTPDKVTGVKVTKIKATQAKIKWDKLDGVSGYKIKLMSKKGKKIKVYSITSNQNYKTIKKLTSGKSYKVKVRAINSVEGTDYKGAWSSIKKFKTL